MKEVSIIVPVYNTKEEYLRNCINSLINQTISEKIEIIIVDDGSNTKCAKICDEYSQKYNNIEVLHQKNKGPGISRNRGIDLATGEWIMFVDSDDWVENNICEELLNGIENNVDIIISACNKCYKNKKIQMSMFEKEYKNLEKEKLELQLISKSFLGKNAYCASNLMVYWARLYRRDFIKNNKLNCVTKIRYMEDFIFNLYCFECARKIVYKDYFLYNYRQRKNSESSINYFGRIDDYLKYIKEEEGFIKKYNKPQIFYEAHKVRTISSIVAAINKHIYVPDMQYKDAIKVINKLLEQKNINTYLYEVNTKYFTRYEQLCVFLLRNKAYYIFYLISLIRFFIKNIKIKEIYFEE